MIRLTFVSDTQRAFVDEYDTDDLAEALIAQAESFRLRDEDGDASNRGPETWIFAFIVERDGAVIPQEEVVTTFRRIANLEGLRGARRDLRPANWKRRDALIEQLRRAVYADDAEAHAGEDLEHLLWEVGEFRRRAEDAHSALDLMDVPRESGAGVLTLRGRLDLLRERGAR